MTCPKCGKTVPDGSTFCNHCGKKLTVQKRKVVKVRGNGQGCAIRRGKTWTAIVTMDWIKQEDPSKPKKPIRKSKGGSVPKRKHLPTVLFFLQAALKNLRRPLACLPIGKHTRKDKC